MSSAIDDSKSSLEDCTCPICLSIMVYPVTMPCQHELCMPCFKLNMTETSLSCPLCRKRISTWTRCASRSNTLVNETRWKQIQELFPERIKRRMEGKDEDTNENTLPHTDVNLAKPGEIRKEYEEQLNKIYQDRLAEDRKQAEKSERLIAELKKEEEEENCQWQIKLQEIAKLDEILAQQLDKIINNTDADVPVDSLLVETLSESEPGTSRTGSQTEINLLEESDSYPYTCFTPSEKSSEENNYPSSSSSYNMSCNCKSPEENNIHNKNFDHTQLPDAGKTAVSFVKENELSNSRNTDEDIPYFKPIASCSGEPKQNLTNYFLDNNQVTDMSYKNLVNDNLSHENKNMVKKTKSATFVPSWTENENVKSASYCPPDMNVKVRLTRQPLHKFLNKNIELIAQESELENKYDTNVSSPMFPHMLGKSREKIRGTEDKHNEPSCSNVLNHKSKSLVCKMSKRSVNKPNQKTTSSLASPKRLIKERVKYKKDCESPQIFTSGEISVMMHSSESDVSLDDNGNLENSISDEMYSVTNKNCETNILLKDKCETEKHLNEESSEDQVHSGCDVRNGSVTKNYADLNRTFCANMGETSVYNNGNPEIINIPTEEPSGMDKNFDVNSNTCKQSRGAHGAVITNRSGTKTSLADVDDYEKSINLCQQHSLSSDHRTTFCYQEKTEMLRKQTNKRKKLNLNKRLKINTKEFSSLQVRTTDVNYIPEDEVPSGHFSMETKYCLRKRCQSNLISASPSPKKKKIKKKKLSCGSDMSQEECDKLLAQKLQKQFDLEVKLRLVEGRFKGTDKQYNFRKPPKYD